MPGLVRSAPFLLTMLALASPEIAAGNAALIAPEARPILATSANPTESPAAHALEIHSASRDIHLPLTPGWHRRLRIDNVVYDVFVPAIPRQRTLLVLPGWNNPRTGWIEHTKLASFAETLGYTLVLPELGKTVYASSYYPETTLKWNRVPGGRFLRERFLPEMARRHGLFDPGAANFLLGLSTGGRGVALIALENPGLFRAGAALSGDFDQSRMPRDRLMTAVYGPFSRYPERWTGRDNPLRRAAEWKMPLYLAHGLEDHIVPEEQSRLFYQTLHERLHDTVPLEYHPVEGAGHDYGFWATQLPAVFSFFEHSTDRAGSSHVP